MAKNFDFAKVLNIVTIPLVGAVLSFIAWTNLQAATLMPSSYHDHDPWSGRYSNKQLDPEFRHRASRHRAELQQWLNAGYRNFAFFIQDNQEHWGTNGPLMLYNTTEQVYCGRVGRFEPNFLGTCLKNFTSWLRDHRIDQPIILGLFIPNTDDLQSLSWWTAENEIETETWTLERLVALDSFVYSQLRGFMFRESDLPPAVHEMIYIDREADVLLAADLYWETDWDSPEATRNKVIVTLEGYIGDEACTDNALRQHFNSAPAMLLCSSRILMQHVRAKS